MDVPSLWLDSVLLTGRRLAGHWHCPLLPFAKSRNIADRTSPLPPTARQFL